MFPCLSVPVLRTFVHEVTIVSLDDETVSTEQQNEVDVLSPVIPSTTIILLSNFNSQKDLKLIKIRPRLTRKVDVQKRDWAHVINVNQPLANFHELVPEVAHKVLDDGLPAGNACNTVIIVSLRVGHVSEASCIPSGTRRLCFCRGSHFCWKDCCCGIRNCSRRETYDEVPSSWLAFGLHVDSSTERSILLLSKPYRTRNLGTSSKRFFLPLSEFLRVMSK